MADQKRPVGGSSKPAGSRKDKRSLWVRIPLWTLSILLILGLVGAGVVAFAYMTVKLPDPNSDFKTNTTFVYYNDGKTKIGSFQVQNRQSISYDKMPQHLKDAIVAAENRTFWTDPGVSPTGLFRAALGLVGLSPADVTASGGGSTITQQYIKIMYLSSERSFTRKAKELLLATKMGQQLDKQDILEGYLNTVYFGRGAYGVEAAAQAYFKVPATKLSLAQSVAIAAIANSPGNLDPAAGKKEAADLLERYQYTLNGMVEAKTITEAQRAKIYTKLPKFPKIAKNSAFGGPKGFLLAMVKKELLAKGFTDEQISGGGLKVITTFDEKAQKAAVEAAEKVALQAAGGSAKQAKKYHPGIASIDNGTGGILAVYGGPDYVASQWNWATNPRPTGSTFKPYALAAALREGWSLKDTLNGSNFVANGRMVHNAGRNYGRISLQNATTHSVNSAYVDLVMQLKGGPEAVQTVAEDAGLPESTYWDLSNRIALGTSEVSPVNQAAAYSTFANGGVRHEAHVVSEVISPGGTHSYTADLEGSQTIEADVAADVTYALTKVTQDGTGGRASSLGYPVAGKTGSAYYTASNNSSTKMVAAWFVGYTKQITTAVMYVKGKQGTADLGGRFYGSTYPLSTWLEYMRPAMDGKKRLDFDRPTSRPATKSPSKPKPHRPKPVPTHTSSPSPTSMPTDEPTDDPTDEPTVPTVPPSHSVKPKPTSTKG